MSSATVLYRLDLGDPTLRPAQKPDAVWSAEPTPAPRLERTVVLSADGQGLRKGVGKGSGKESVPQIRRKRSVPRICTLALLIADADIAQRTLRPPCAGVQQSSNM